MSHVHQCPECELRFAAEWELTDHLAQSHPAEEAQQDEDEPL
jgi:hypothetical protein